MGRRSSSSVPERRSVEPFADVIVDLHSARRARSLLEVDPSRLNTAIALGEEWLGPDSAILKCLRLGVALHHGALPTAYRKEVERLLRDGVLKVTISSPTLAQGLNLSATAVIMHSLIATARRIEISEFKNVIGRAGRAYVDVEGIVLFPMFEDIAKKAAQLGATHHRSRRSRDGKWPGSACRGAANSDARAHRRRSRPTCRICRQQRRSVDFPRGRDEKPEDRERALAEWERHIATLDTAILSLIGENDVPDDGIEAALDDILQSSLWQRRLLRHE